MGPGREVGAGVDVAGCVVGAEAVHARERLGVREHDLEHVRRRRRAIKRRRAAVRRQLGDVAAESDVAAPRTGLRAAA